MVVVLVWLATGNSYHTVGEMFGVHSSTVYKFATAFLDGIFEKRNDFIKFPVSREEIQKSIDKFNEKNKLPHAMGAVYGTHVEIKKPEGDSSVDYFSRKKNYTIVNQVVCDGNLKFLSVDAGFP